MAPRTLQTFDNHTRFLPGFHFVALPLLLRASDASVVFTLDSRGQEPRAYWGGYAVTKAAIAALARELASRNITVNVVAPGLIETDMTKAITEKDMENSLGNRIRKGDRLLLRTEHRLYSFRRQ